MTFISNLKSKNNCNKLNHGFGLMEVIMALGLMGFVSTLVGTLTYQTLRSSITAETSSDFSNLSSEIHSVLGREELCTQALGAKSVSGGTNDFELQLPGSSVKLVKDQAYGRLIITKNQIKVSQAVPGTKNFIGELQISYKKPESALGSAGELKKSFFFYFVANNSSLPSTIKNCFGQQSPQGMCMDMGGHLYSFC